MAWETYQVEEQKLMLVTEYVTRQSTMTDLCKRFRVSRKTGYKWVQRFLESGEEGLKVLSRAPHTRRIKFAPEQIDLAIDLKNKYRNWGPKKILAKLETSHPQIEWPSPTRLYQIFKEYNLVRSKRKRSRIPATAPLGALNGCNSTWAVDLKGWFLTEDGRKCEPLTISDCCSRYLVRCIHLNKHSVEHVWPVFDEAFREFGLPERVRSDNGPPFGSVGTGRFTKLSINLIKAGVLPEWINPGHPEENGRHERIHLTLKQEVATPPRKTLVEQIQALEDFQNMYNFERPHEALNMKTPASCYQVSTRKWDGILRSPEYDRKEMGVRKVGQSGCIWIQQKEIYIGQVLTGEYVGLKEIEEDKIKVYYGPVYLGLLDKSKGRKLETPKRLRRR